MFPAHARDHCSRWKHCIRRTHSTEPPYRRRPRARFPALCPTAPARCSIQGPGALRLLPTPSRALERGCPSGGSRWPRPPHHWLPVSRPEITSASSSHWKSQRRGFPGPSQLTAQHCTSSQTNEAVASVPQAHWIYRRTATRTGPNSTPTCKCRRHYFPMPRSVSWLPWFPISLRVALTWNSLPDLKKIVSRP